MRRSYHCRRCHACTEGIDHHCRYLNCCIAERNYEPFLRLLGIYILYTANLTAILLLFCQLDPLTLVVVAVTGLQLLMCVALFGFHVYINVSAKMTTAAFIKGQKEQQQAQSEEYRDNELE